MKTYTQQELLRAVQYACEYQKACDYQEAAMILLGDGYKTTNADVKVLDLLSDSIINHYNEIPIKDIEDYIKEVNVVEPEN